MTDNGVKHEEDAESVSFWGEARRDTLQSLDGVEGGVA